MDRVPGAQGSCPARRVYHWAPGLQAPGVATSLSRLWVRLTGCKDHSCPGEPTRLWDLPAPAVQEHVQLGDPEKTHPLLPQACVHTCYPLLQTLRAALPQRACSQGSYQPAGSAMPLWPLGGKGRGVFMAGQTISCSPPRAGDAGRAHRPVPHSLVSPSPPHPPVPRFLTDSLTSGPLYLLGPLPVHSSTLAPWTPCL